MSVTSTEAAKFLCSLSGWSLNRNVLHKLIYIASVVYEGRYHKPLIKHSFSMIDLHSLKRIDVRNECFVASSSGPLLKALDKRLSVFGARNVRNIFSDESDLDSTIHSEEICVLSECYDATQSWSLSHFVQFVMDKNSAWSKTYNPGEHAIIYDEYLLEEYNFRF